MGFTDKTNVGKAIAQWLLLKGAKIVKKVDKDTTVIYKSHQSVVQKLSDAKKLNVTVVNYDDIKYDDIKEFLKVPKPSTKPPVVVPNEPIQVSDAMKAKIQKFVEQWKKTKYNKKYVDEHHKNYCDTGAKDLQKLQKPMVSINAYVTIPIMFMKGKPFRNTNLDTPKQSFYEIESAASSLYMNNLSLQNILFKHVNSTSEISHFEDLIDLEWIRSMNDYITQLSTKDLYTIVGYTFYGDIVSNNFMRGQLKSSDFLNEVKNQSRWNQGQYYPIFFQALEVFKEMVKTENDLDKITEGKVNVILKSLWKDVHIPGIKMSSIYTKFKKAAGNFTYNKFWTHAIQRYIDDLSRIIRNAPALRKKMVVYRGVKNDYYLKGLAGKMYNTNSFVSTSLNLQSAINFSSEKCCFKRITLLPGTRVLLMDGVSVYPGEFEILLNKDTQFYITNEKTIVNRNTTAVCPSAKGNITVTDAVVVK